MKTPWLILIGAVILLIIITLFTRGSVSQSSSYDSNQYGFSIDYPSDLNLEEYQPESVTLRRGDRDVAHIRVYQAGDVGYESYDDFIFATFKNMCAADSPSGSISCDQIQQQQPFDVGDTSGAVFYMHRLHTNLTTGEIVEDGWGPIFVFNISANIPNSQYTILAIEPPLNIISDEVQSDLLRTIAESVKIKKIENQGNTSRAGNAEMIALVSSINTTSTSTVVTFDPVEWLQEDEAREAAANDTECEVSNVEECIESLNNNFYIRNAEIEANVYPISSDAHITLQKEAQTTQATIGDVELKLKDLHSSLPFNISIQNGEIVNLEELYLP